MYRRPVLFARPTLISRAARSWGQASRACVGIADHPTHVAGTIGGAGVANPTFKGMAPGVNIVSHTLNQGGGCSLSSGFLYTDPCDMQTDYGEAINGHNAVLANNSIGTNTAPNGFPCSWEGDYGVTDTVIDAIVRGSASSSGARCASSGPTGTSVAPGAVARPITRRRSGVREEPYYRRRSELQ